MLTALQNLDRIVYQLLPPDKLLAAGGMEAFEAAMHPATEWQQQYRHELYSITSKETLELFTQHTQVACADLLAKLEQYQDTLKQHPAGNSTKKNIEAIYQTIHQDITALLALPRCYRQPAPATDQSTQNPPLQIKTKLSVRQAALLLRVLADGGLLECESPTGLFAQLAPVLQTRNGKNATPESFKTGYYTQDMATRSILRDHIVSLLNVLKSYGN